MKKSTKSFILSISLGILAISSIGSTFAFFRKSTKDSFDVGTNISHEDVLDVSSFSDLYFASINPIFNEISGVANNRKVIRLQNDIVLSNDINISIDAHIDLNNHILDLNGHSLNVSHGYYGAFDIGNGIIKPYNKSLDAGHINIDTPNATILVDSLSFKDSNNIVIIDNSPFINVVRINEKYTAYNALYLVSEQLGNDFQKYKDRLKYNDIALLDTFDSSLFIYNHDCSLSSNYEGCFFTSIDLDLPTYYLSKDIEISYESSNESVLSSLGQINPTSDIEDVTLNVKVSSSMFSSDFNCSFKLHVVDKENDSHLSLIGGELIKSYLSESYHNDSITFGDSNVHNGYYLLSTGIELPLRSDDYNIDYSYKAYSDKACTHEVITDSIETDNSLLFEPNNQCFYLKVMYKGTSSVLNTYSTYISTDESVARTMVNALYGGSFVYDSSSDAHTLYGWDYISSEPRFQKLISVFNITGVTYSIPKDSDAKDDYIVHRVNSSQTLDLITDSPNKTKEGSLRVTFTIAGIKRDVDIYIIYVSSGGESISSFLTYYSIYTNMVPTNPTLEEFYMPLTYNDSPPYIVYDFAYDYSKTLDDGITTYSDVILRKPESLIVSLVDEDDNILTTLEYNSNSSLSESFDEYLISEGYIVNANPSPEQLVSAYPGVQWKFSFDRTKINGDDLDVLLIYNYKFSSVGSWSQFNKLNEDSSHISENLLIKKNNYKSSIDKHKVTKGIQDIYYETKNSKDNIEVALKEITEMKKHGMGLSSTQMMRSIRELAGKLNFKNADELLIKIGNGKESVKNITNKLLKMVVDNGDKKQL